MKVRSVWMMSAVLAGAAMAAPAAFGTELVAYDGDDQIHFAAAECTNAAVLAHIDPSIHAAFHAATAMLGGRKFEACWSMLPSAAYLVYEDGDQGLVPASRIRQPVDI